MAEAGNQLTADQMEDAILEILPSVDSDRLEYLFTLVDLPVPAEQQGRKNALRKTLMRFLCSPNDDGEEKTEEWLVVFSNLYPTGVVPKREGTTEEVPTTENVVTEMTTQMVTDMGTGDHVGLLASADRLLTRAQAGGGQNNADRQNTLLPRSTQHVSVAAIANLPAPPQTAGGPPRSVFSTGTGNAPLRTTPLIQPRVEEIQVTRHRLREFKLPGMIGGSGESALAYSSLEFEVKKAKNLGYTELEIVSAIIPKIADKELRKGCELEEDLNLEELMDTLRSCTAEARDSAAAFREYSHAAQKWEEGETVATFVSRMYRLRKEILKLGAEEGVTYDLVMLKKQGFAALINGIRDENVRMGVRERCAGNVNLTRAQMMKYVADVVQVEAERKKRLFPKKEKEVSACSVEQLEQLKLLALNAGESSKATKKKNPFTEIEELRTQMVGEINEIKGLILAQNSRFQDQQASNTRGGGGGGRSQRRRPYKRCPNCEAANAETCTHCWKCSSDQHKSNACPNAGNA